MQLNISSLLYYFDELSDLLNDLTINFNIIGITESRLRSEKSPLSDINLPNYISNELNYKVRNTFQIHIDKKTWVNFYSGNI